MATQRLSARIMMTTAFTATLLVLAGCSESEPPAMPDVIGESLETGRSAVEGAGFEGELEIAGGGVFGVVDESNWTICDQTPAAGSPIEDTPTLTVERDCAEPTSREDSSDGPSEAPTDAETAADPSPAATPYLGHPYDVVITDANEGITGLTRYWVYVEGLDLSSDGYKEAVKQIVADLAAEARTADIMVDVVSNLEVAQARAQSTMEGFRLEHGDDYIYDTILPLQAESWIASYSGGFDGNTLSRSTEAAAYTIIWRPYADDDLENWKPEVPAGN